MFIFDFVVDLMFWTLMAIFRQRLIDSTSGG